mmetsp:Transcript_4482/g.7887  ORF Transcript_4482/g.7887 Transcript_4482/m.7887 type:complete len:207 (-) Transcript_4482:48-668(-)|eukprot:CAMPEP_0184523386 /NCGR_PEP_ID=MMETSP0198_2-20121128/8853_1 /TAXON_ID=1112570 /ORGANISM="Thraustochytrium sp., Strain LLF1b" /LENGTH=206 /DNA_ID=CAMNT_0026914407 /DNA_START=308 /DNA_END=928 /DNA_ORIENTATION=+
MEFFKKTTVKEVARKTKREIGRGQRELDREKNKLVADERRLIAEIKKAASKGDGGGNNGQVRALAKQLVQVRNAKTKLTSMHGNLGAVKTKTTMMAASATVADTMKSTSKAMGRANKAMNVTKMQKQMMEFERNMESMNVTEEMMNDTLSALDEDGEEEVDAITKQVLDEIGVDLSSMLDAAPTGEIATEKKRVSAKKDEGAELVQ